jgi:hypothetical protein
MPSVYSLHLTYCTVRYGTVNHCLIFHYFILSFIFSSFRLPKIPETLGRKGRQIVFESTDIDTSTIPYQHKERETARKNKMEKVKKEKADMIAQEALDAAEDEDSDDEEVNQPHIMSLPTTSLCLCLFLFSVSVLFSLYYYLLVS